MLLLKDARQVVDVSISGLAFAAGVTEEEAREAIESFKVPDASSRSRDEEGRRVIERPDGGWFVVNGEKYQQAWSADDRRAYQREWVANKRKVLKERRKAAEIGGRTAAVSEILEDGK